jgi:hypothetical protein
MFNGNGRRRSLGKSKAKARRVNFHHDPYDRKVMKMIALGKSTDFICGATGLTESQVNYRATLLPLKRAMVRSGNDPITYTLMRDERVGKIVMYHMDRLLDKHRLV